MNYSSPQALLNRYFKGNKKFIYMDDEYSSEDFKLTWIEGEVFVLSKRIMDFDTNADYYEDVNQGLLIDLVTRMRKFYKTNNDKDLL